MPERSSSSSLVPECGSSLRGRWAEAARGKVNEIIILYIQPATAHARRQGFPCPRTDVDRRCEPVPAGTDTARVQGSGFRLRLDGKRLETWQGGETRTGT